MQKDSLSLNLITPLIDSKSLVVNHPMPRLITLIHSLISLHQAAERETIVRSVAAGIPQMDLPQKGVFFGNIEIENEWSKPLIAVKSTVHLLSESNMHRC